jgi:hypothetical protein
MSELGALLDEIDRAATASARFATPVGAVGLAVSSREVLEWPVGYLPPGIEVVPDRDPVGGEWSVVVSCEPAHLARLAGVVAGRPHTASETYESRPASRVEVDGRTVLRYPADAGVTVVDRDRRRVAYLDPDPTRAGFESARLVREVVRRLGEESGEVVLHAGAVVLAGRAWVISGAKGAGKTTSVCALMEYADAAFIANDRVHLRQAAGFDVRAWPMSTRIGVGTCTASPRLRPLLSGGRRLAYPQTGWDPDRGLTAAAIAIHVAARSGPKIELVTQELCEVLGAEATGGAPVGGVLLPEHGAPVPGVAKADPADVREVLMGQVFTPDDEAYPDWLELRATPREILWQRTSDLVDSLLMAVGAFRVSFTNGRQLVDLLASRSCLTCW